MTHCPAPETLYPSFKMEISREIRYFYSSLIHKLLSPSFVGENLALLQSFSAWERAEQPLLLWLWPTVLCKGDLAHAAANPSPISHIYGKFQSGFRPSHSTFFWGSVMICWGSVMLSVCWLTRAWSLRLLYSICQHLSDTVVCGIP